MSLTKDYYDVLDPYLPDEARSVLHNQRDIIEEKIAQLFGFEGLTEKFSGLIGPIVFGYLATSYSYTEALISVIVFFVVGLWLMRKL